jgi:hypothetical protein
MHAGGQDKKVLIVECKRLRLARTIAEIAESCRRFEGEAKDDLAKHVDRTKWINQNLPALRSLLGFVPRASDIDAPLVTNVDVPMMYLESLPFPREKIIPFRALRSSFAKH